VSSATQQHSSWRFHVVWLALVLLGCILAWRIVMLQVVDRGFLQAQGDARAIRTVATRATRGVIFDRYGEPLAVSTPVVSIWANPKQVLASNADLSVLAKSLGMSTQALEKKINSKANKGFMYLKRQLPPAVAGKILALKYKGVYRERDYKRYYPSGEIAGHLVGFTGLDGTGQEGLELAFDKHLQSVDGSKQILKDLYGNTIKELKQITESAAGKDLQLSIDLRMQYSAYRTLKEAVAKANAQAGSIVLMDVHTGEVLALASQPAFNPNNRSQLKLASLRNRAITDAFEPGSTVKPFTILAALESGKYKPETIVDTNPGYIKVGRKTLQDHHNNGPITVSEIIMKSSQVGITKVALSIEADTVREAFQRVGLGQSPGTGFPGEGVGVVPSRAKWLDIERATFAYGYGLSVTALQLAQAYQVIAADGVMRRATLLKQSGPIAEEQVVDPQIARQLQAMLAKVMREGGTAASARTVGFSLAGKTGTAHKIGKNGYQEDKYRSLFAGMAPAISPKVVGVVVIEDPKGGRYYGGEIAAPVFAGVMGDILPLLNTRPDILDKFAVKPKQLEGSNG
jgi:cell division protein FtsI (penicillin-binding protein 3)